MSPAVMFESPTLRVRYRNGLTVGAHGYPDWLPYARVAVQLPVGGRELGVDEARVLDVLTANAVLAASGDPLWAGLPEFATPTGWTWAHLELCRTLVLVPIGLYAATRHRGGVSTGVADRGRRGLPGVAGPAPRPVFHERLAAATVEVVEQAIGPLPPAYRLFLMNTNGAAPDQPALHPDFGFVLDQPFFGIDRDDRLTDLGYTAAAFRDRLTTDLFPIAYVQGGLLALRLSGPDAGSVWLYDNDDPREDPALRPEEISARLLVRCADDFDAFWAALSVVPQALRQRARAAAAGSWPVVLSRMGTQLPAKQRPPRPQDAPASSGAGR